MVGTKTLICGVWLCGVWIAIGSAEAGPPGASDSGPPIMIGESPPGMVEPAPDAADAADAPGAADDAAGAAAREGPARVRRAPARFSVTGSLIERATLTTPSPLTILGRGDLLAAGRSMIGDVLQPLPEQGNALNAQFNNGGDGSTRLSLRSLEPGRTLVLLDGRRFVPGGLGADSAVDLNTIPLAVIDRVEVLKDGASAIYGSDAVGGVVNLITRNRFEGTEATVYTGESSRKDGFTFDASFITGRRFADGRGHVVFSAGTQRQDPVFAGDREYSKVTNIFDFNTGAIIPTGSPATPNGRINAKRIDLNGDGIPDPINLCGANVQFCTINGAGGFRPFANPGDLFNFQPDNYLYTPSARGNAYAAGSFKLGSATEGFFQASFLHRASDQRLAAEPLNLDLTGAAISRFSIYNPIGGDVLSYNRRLQEFGPRRFLQSVDTMRVVVGVRGAAAADAPVLDGWKWEVSYNYGRTDATQRIEGEYVTSRLRNAIGPSFMDSSGAHCGTPTAPILGCVPMNLLGGDGAISPAARDYAGFTGVEIGDTTQQTAVATAHGQLVRLPGGGDISLAVTADFRRDTGNFTPDALIASGDTPANVPAPVHGENQVEEAAAELSIVPLRDRDGTERLELDFATRAFRYDSFGTGAVSSIRALVRPIRAITLRASRSGSFRAPNVTELFQDRVVDFPFGTDPCDTAFGPLTQATARECARQGVPANAMFGTSQQRAATEGNELLQPETAQVMSAGAVLELPPRTGLSLSVDWWSIELTGAIQLPSLQTVFTNCFTFDVRSSCDRIHRKPALGGAIDFVDLAYDNQGGTSTSGVDAAINFDHRAPGLGDLHARLELQTLNNFDVDTGAGTVLHGLGNFDLGVHPKRKLEASAQWHDPGGLSVGFVFHFIDSFQECDGNSCQDPATPSRTVDSYEKLDVFSTIALGRGPGDVVLTLGINNVLDQAPPAIYNSTSGNYDPATYDLIGRFAYARLTQSF